MMITFQFPSQMAYFVNNISNSRDLPTQFQNLKREIRESRCERQVNSNLCLMQGYEHDSDRDKRRPEPLTINPKINEAS